MSHRLRTIASLVALSCIVVLVSCSSEASETKRYESLQRLGSVTPTAEVLAAPKEAAVSADAVAAPAPPPELAGAELARPSRSASHSIAQLPSPMIIRNGSASVRVDSLEVAIAAIRRIATSLGGWVGNASLAVGDNDVRTASLELKVPAARYDEAMSGLAPIGKLESSTSTAEDVGEEYVDLSARMVNAHRLEERLIALLASRTGKLEDVLNVERELARVREEIERFEGRLRFLRTRVATSTIALTLHEPMPIVAATPGQSVLGEAFKDAWRNFVHFVAAFIASLGTLIPVLVLLAVGLLVWRRFRPRPAVAVVPSLRTGDAQ